MNSHLNGSWNLQDAIKHISSKLLLQGNVSTPVQHYNHMLVAACAAMRLSLCVSNVEEREAYWVFGDSLELLVSQQGRLVLLPLLHHDMNLASKPPSAHTQAKRQGIVALCSAQGLPN